LCTYLFFYVPYHYIHTFERIYKAAEESPDPNNPWVHCLLGFSNAFNELNVELSLLNLRTLWPRGAMYIFNCYRGWTPILWRDKQPARSVWKCLQEGFAQGDPIASAAFCLSTIDMLKKACDSVNALAPPIDPHLQGDIPLPNPIDDDNWAPPCRGSEGGHLRHPDKLARQVQDQKRPVVAAYIDDIQAAALASNTICFIRAIKGYGDAIGVKLNFKKTVLVVQTEAEAIVTKALLSKEEISAIIAFSAHNLGAILKGQMTPK